VQLHPLSDTHYHDWDLDGVELPSDAVRLRLRSNGDRAIVELTGVAFFIAADLMKGNIISELGKLLISTDSISWILDDLLSFNSQYFTKSEADHFRSSANFLGKSYVVVSCSYGVRIGAICESTREISVPGMYSPGLK
jgi:hypothetical protein